MKVIKREADAAIKDRLVGTVVTCEICGAVLEIEHAEDVLLHGGAPYITCPDCGNDIMVLGYTLSESEVLAQAAKIVAHGKEPTMIRLIRSMEVTKQELSPIINRLVAENRLVPAKTVNDRYYGRPILMYVPAGQFSQFMAQLKGEA